MRTRAEVRVWLTSPLVDTILVFLALTVSAPQSVRADAVVGTGSGSSCTEVALDAALGCGAPSGKAPVSICTSGGTITFNCGPSQSIITVTSRKALAANASIDGGSLVTLSGGGTTGVLGVSMGVTVTVANLTISDGASYVAGSDTRGAAISNAGTLLVTNSTLSANNADFGAAIDNSGMLTVIDSTFSGNSAIEGAAIWNGSTLVITNSTFSGNGNSANADGAAIYNSKAGTVTASNSTFSGNSAGFGGAIFNAGMVTATNSTFAGNSASFGGAISSNNMLTLSNSTFSGNSAIKSGGAIDNQGPVTVTNGTLSGNSAEFGGAISNLSSSGTVTLTNTIVANSSAGGNCDVSGGIAITDGGNNIDDGTTCSFAGTGCTETSGSSFCNLSPLLDPAGLATNGGPTQTIALQASSPAIDAGNESVCAAPPVNSLDQRGYLRPGTGATNCSIGAVEAHSPTATACVGDCDGSGEVTVDELITLVNIDLGTSSPLACANGIPSGAAIDITLIIQAVNIALNNCPAS